MPCDLPLSNGRLLVNFDANYDLRDIYWPHIGLRNVTLGHSNRSGVWVDGAFSWFAAADWKRTLVYEPDTLVTQVTLSNATLQLTVSCTDAVDFHRDVFIRKLRVLNTAGHSREMRLFFHHDWHIDESEGGNTVYYQPSLQALVAYRNHAYFLVQDIANVPGNPWFICACWLAEYHIAQARTLDELHEALSWLKWVQQHALPSGVLAEQVNPYTEEPLSVSPLTWSHAEYAGAIRWYAGKYLHLTAAGAAPGIPIVSPLDTRSTSVPG